MSIIAYLIWEKLSIQRAAAFSILGSNCGGLFGCRLPAEDSTRKKNKLHNPVKSSLLKMYA